LRPEEGEYARKAVLNFHASEDTMTTPLAHKDPKLPPPIALPEGPDWTSALRLLDRHAASTLFAAARTLYPHEGLPDRIYRRVVAQFDRMAANSPAAAQTFAGFVALVDGAMPLPFAELTEGYRTQVLKAVEGSGPFRFVQRATVRFLYDDVEVWEAFGYEGAAVQLGGYARRGFDDLRWLPDPPAGEI
jgi:hypothetical protein